MTMVRGSGRTTGMVRTLPNDGEPVVVVIHHFAFAGYVQALIHKEHGDYKGRVNFVTSAMTLRGLPRSRIFVDHHAAEVVDLRGLMELHG